MANFRKRVLSAALSACMLFGSAALLPESSFDGKISISASAETWNGFEYEVKGTSRVNITAYTGKEKNVTVPKEINGIKVRMINQSVFEGNTTIENVVIESDLDYIIHYMFKDCTSLKSVRFTGSCDYAYHNVFENCTNLESVKLPDDLLGLNNSFFKGCYKLSDIQMSKDINSVSVNNFADTKWLADMKKKSPLVVYGNLLIDASEYRVTDYTIPSNIKYIGGSAFKGNQYLKSIVVPDTVEKIGGSVFQECINLEKAVINVVQDTYNTLFYKCTKLSDVTLGEGVKKLWNYIFMYCSSLKKIKIPSTVKDIGFECFSDCTALEEVDIPYGLEQIGYHCFSNCTSLKKLWIPDTVKKIEERAFYNCFPDPMIIPAGVEKIKEKAFGYTGSHFDTDYTITGYKDSLAQQYANENGLKFKEITECSHPATRYGKVAATCENDGYDGYRCRICNKLISGKEFKATGHDWAEPVWDWSSGYPMVTFACKNDSSHDQTLSVGYSISYVDPTCTKDGKKIRKAEVYFSPLNKTYTDTNETTISKKGHTIRMKSAKAATCTKDGNIKYWYCSVCGKYFSDKDGKNEITKASTVAKAEGHKLIAVAAKAATCTDAGNKAYWYCSACKKHFSDKDGKNEITKESTVAKAEGHKLTAVAAKAATCTVAGNKAYWYCSACGKYFSDKDGKNEITKASTIAKAEGHKFGKWTTASFDTTKGTSVQTRKCSICGELETKTVKDAVKRLAGDNRFITAVEISKASFTKAGTVVLAYGLNYADALAGVPLATKLNAPILLTAKDTLPEVTLTEIKRLGAKNIIILGGTGAISDKVEKLLKDNKLTTERIAGTTRFGTATAIGDRLNKKPTDIFFVYGLNYADALSVSTVAALKNAPIIYLTKDGKLNADTEKYLKSIKGSVKNAYVIGGEGVISNDMADQAAKALGLKNVTRVAGKDRFKTCVAVNEQFKDVLNGEMICVATGMDFPDALAGGVYAAKNKAPLFLINGKAKTLTLNDEQKAYLKSKNAKAITTFGGTGAVPDGHIKEIAKNSI